MPTIVLSLPWSSVLSLAIVSPGFPTYFLPLSVVGSTLVPAPHLVLSFFRIPIHRLPILVVGSSDPVSLMIKRRMLRLLIL